MSEVQGILPTSPANAANAVSSAEPDISVASLPVGAEGATIVQVSAQRQMRVFPISESELRNLGFLNGLTAFFLALAGSAFTTALSIKIGVNIESGTMTDKAELLDGLGFVVCLVVGLVFLILCAISWRISGSITDQIKKESRFSE
jgi:hypothetical protein